MKADIWNIPCFACLIKNNMKMSSHRCNPKTCDKLERWLMALVEQRDLKEKGEFSDRKEQKTNLSAHI